MDSKYNKVTFLELLVSTTTYDYELSTFDISLLTNIIMFPITQLRKKHLK